jgi:hypothetical protein
MFDDQELILGPLEQSNQDSTDQPVHEDVARHKLQEDSLPKENIFVSVAEIIRDASPMDCTTNPIENY